MEPKITEKNLGRDSEKELFQKWLAEKQFTFNQNSGKPVFVIDNPPAYPSGHWHPGAIAGYSYIDMIARVQRMKGSEVYFPFCLDRNGLPVEIATEKKYGKSGYSYDREEFLKLCEKTITEFGDEVHSIYQMVGYSADYDNYYYTDAVDYRKLTQATFIELWNRGLIYEDKKPTNWCPACRTTIADSEIEYVEEQTMLNSLKFKVKETGEELIIATTRPELLCACQAVIFNPEDSRYSKLAGKHAVIPVYGREVPLLKHPSASMEYGTGLVMICSYGDITDVQLFNELKLKPIIALDEGARLTEASGKYKGLKVKDARKAIIDDLKAEGTLIEQKPVMHRSPTCERSHTPLEIIAMDEYWLKQLDFLDDMRKAADDMKFYPEKNKQILLDWINSVTIDWPISRRRYYATEIPLWTCTKCGKKIVPKPGKYYQPWKETPADLKCTCGSTELVGETRVFDTWMDSSISNLYTTGYLRDEKLFEKAYPCAIRPQGRDIVRTWLYYTMLRNLQLTGKAPFKNVFIHGMGLDEHGKKMSKSKGNFLEPIPTLTKYGPDAFRLWAASETNLGEDFKMSEERISGSAKFLTKFWNTAKFISSFEYKQTGELKNTDMWILSELNNLVKESVKGYDDYNFFVPATKMREFVWNLFASQYLEMAKSRAYEGDSGAIYTLHTCLQTICKLMAPIIPFTTDKIYRDVYGITVHREQLPEVNPAWESSFNTLTQKIVDFNSEVWKTKKDKGMSLNTEIEGIKIPTELKPFEEDFVKMHKLK